MSITIELKPEIEAVLAKKAEARGVDLRSFVTAVLENAAQPEAPEDPRSLAQLFAGSPFAGLDMDFPRDPDFGRDIEL